MKNEKKLESFKLYLRGKYPKINTWRPLFYQTRAFLKYIEDDVENLTKDDMLRWKIYINEKFMVNGNIKRIMGVNLFTKWLGRDELRLPIPHQVEANIITMSDKEIERYIDASKENALWELIAILQVDGILRPGEFANLKIKNIDFNSLKLYLDDTKTGNNYIMISPRLAKAIENYLPYRAPIEGHEEYLIIIPNGRYRGRAPTKLGSFILNQTKKIALEAGIDKHVTPYVVKPSVITSDFNNHVNPKVIQHKARHGRLESTMRYDHSTDKDIQRHFLEEEKKRLIPAANLDEKQMKKMLFERFITGELDKETFKRSIDLLSESDRKDYEGIGYV